MIAIIIPSSIPCEALRKEGILIATMIFAHNPWTNHITWLLYYLNFWKVRYKDTIFASSFCVANPGII